MRPPFAALPSCAACVPLSPRPCLAQVIYSHAQAKALHHAPLFIVLLLPLLALSSGDAAQQLGWGGLLRGTLLALSSVLCALGLPAALGAGRALLSGEASEAGVSRGEGELFAAAGGKAPWPGEDANEQLPACCGLQRTGRTGPPHVT